MKTKLNIEAKKITSVTIQKFLEAGGEITRLETISADRPDDVIHIFECAGRDGSFTSDNACVTYWDGDFERVVRALRSGDFEDINRQAVSEI